MPSSSTRPFLHTEFSNASEDRLLLPAANNSRAGPPAILHSTRLDATYSHRQHIGFETTNNRDQLRQGPSSGGLGEHEDENDATSENSHTQLRPQPVANITNTGTRSSDSNDVDRAAGIMSYPPQRPPLDLGSSSFSSAPSQPAGHVYDTEAGPRSGPGKLRKPHSSGGWGKKDAEQGYEELEELRASNSNSNNGFMSASDPHLIYPDGPDQSKTKLGKAYSYLITASIITRWILFIVPILGIVWIPGILSLTSFPEAGIWGVRLLWWSIWLSVVWGGWWAALATARIIPGIIRSTVGVVAVSTRRYIDWLQALHRYIALFAWTIAIWVSFGPLIDKRQPEGTGQRSVAAVDLVAKILFALLLCTALLLFEKFAIQWIAGKFHERSYAERIVDQKFAVRTLVTLYKHSIDIPGRTDTLGPSNIRSTSVNPRRIFQKLRQGVRFATTTTATVFGNVASEIAGSSVLQPNSPQAIIKTVLESANKSRLLARRLFYSFAKNSSEFLLLEDIERYFPTKEEAILAFALFDKDSNGDVSREEVEMACLDFHREQLSIENSMRDLDSAVGRLDNILMSVYVIIAILIIAVALDAQVTTLVTGAGTLILGLSWLIGGSLQEVLTSIIFLFIKHPFDVGDRVVLNKETYTVKEIRLLSTVFLDSNSALIQAPNNQLNTLFIQNIRRSPHMSETFTFDVSYTTSFADLERLRDRMLEFVTAERRDYQPVFDVTVKDFPEQTKMTLSADIKYKSNGQQGALKAKRRNKWICALKTILAEIKIYGPGGDPNPPPGVSRYTKVPWDLIDMQDQEALEKSKHMLEVPRSPTDGWKLDDKNAAILDGADEVFGDSSELHLTNPRRGLSQANLLDAGASQPPAFRAPQAMPAPHAAEVFEMRPRP